MNISIYESSIFDLAWNIIQSSAISLMFFWIVFNILALGSMIYIFKNNHIIKSKQINRFLNTSFMTVLAAELFDAIKMLMIINYYQKNDFEDNIDVLTNINIHLVTAHDETNLLCKLRELFSSKIYFRYKLA